MGRLCGVHERGAVVGAARLGGNLMSKLVHFMRDESGASAAEYALILAIVGLGIVLAVGALRDAISGAIDKTATKISTYAT